MTQPTSPPLLWLSKTASTGDTQARIAIAEQLGGVWAEFDVPHAFCTPEQTFARLVDAGLIDAAQPRWPDVIIGRSAYIPYMQMIKRLSNNRSCVVAMRPPSRDLPIRATISDIEATDLIVTYPHSDNAGLPNIFVCNTIPNRVTPSRIAAEAPHWAAHYAAVTAQGPVIGFCLGGDIGVEQRRIFSPALAAALGQHMNRFAQTMGASILATLSRRTSPEIAAAWRGQITVPCSVYNPNTDPAPNPYFGLLGRADYLLVTGDSLSMCCEAAATGKPAYVFLDDSILEEGHGTMLEYLLQRGFIRPLGEVSALTPFTYQPENSAVSIADAIRAQWGSPSKTLFSNDW